jgi:hypothetical protein
MTMSSVTRPILNFPEFASPAERERIKQVLRTYDPLALHLMNNPG